MCHNHELDFFIQHSCCPTTNSFFNILFCTYIHWWLYTGQIYALEVSDFISIYLYILYVYTDRYTYMCTHIYTSLIFLLQDFYYYDSDLTFITGKRYIVHSEWYPEYKLQKPCLAVCLLLAPEKPKEYFCLKK